MLFCDHHPVRQLVEIPPTVPSSRPGRHLGQHTALGFPLNGGRGIGTKGPGLAKINQQQLMYKLTCHPYSKTLFKNVQLSCSFRREQESCISTLNCLFRKKIQFTGADADKTYTVIVTLGNHLHCIGYICKIMHFTICRNLYCYGRCR